ncbi:MAG: tail fiber assembly protein [Rhodospirillales bacterium]|nr:tail fiber assembly protein [Rhodospirillales bacterium]
MKKPRTYYVFGRVAPHPLLAVRKQQIVKGGVCGPPSNSTFAQPPEPKVGFHRCWLEGGWAYVEDHRGKVVFDKQTKSGRTVRELGPVPDQETLLQPTSPYDKWDGEKWVEDVDTKRAEEARQVDVEAELNDVKLRLAKLEGRRSTPKSAYPSP